MPQLKLHDTWISFPFVPYKQQEVFMKNVIACLSNKQNGLLESPTGTGKTLCLLCSSLGWLDYSREFETSMETPSVRVTNPLSRKRKHRILFCSRTHSQLQQVIEEFQSTDYCHLRAAFLASRKHLCLNKKVRDDSNVDSKCRTLRKPTRCNAVPPVDIEDMPVKCVSCKKDHPCQYYTNFQEMTETPELKIKMFSEARVMNYSHLLKKCESLKVCPFYVARHLALEADIIFLPYSYVFNVHILKSLKIELKDSILIVDEGHNIERVCEENASVDIKDELLGECLKELSLVKSAYLLPSFPSNIINEDVSELETIVKNIRDSINSLKEGKYLEGDIMLTIFEESGFTSKKKFKLLNHLNQLMNFCSEGDYKADGMRHFVSVAHVILYNPNEDSSEVDQERHLQDMKLAFTVYVDPKLEESYKPRTTHFWCFDASLVMKSLMKKGVWSVIVTSGTLSPLQPLAQSLGIPFSVQEVNDHVIDKEQALGVILKYGPNSVLNSRKDSRDRIGPKYYKDIGLVVLDIATETPNGLLVFFPSKSVRKECLDVWCRQKMSNDLTLYDAINGAKEIFEEPEHNTNLPRFQEDFRKKIDGKNSKGACLLGIMSGKVSEGLDFKDHYGRGVVMIGLPFPPSKDPWVKRKKQVLNLRFGGDEAGAKWYISEATRSVNQGLGRVIRHRLDYGAIILLDYRFEETVTCYEVYKDLPKWLKRNLDQQHHTLLKPTLKTFFEDISEKVSTMTGRIAVEQKLACERYLQDMKAEEIPASQYFKLQTEILEGKQEQSELELKVTDLYNVCSELQTSVQNLQVRIEKEKVIAKSLLKEDELHDKTAQDLVMETSEIESPEVDVYDSDWDSDGKSGWEDLSLDQ